MRISDWSSDACSSDLNLSAGADRSDQHSAGCIAERQIVSFNYLPYDVVVGFKNDGQIYGEENYRVMATDEDQARRKALTNARSEEHTSELQSLMRISYAVFCLKKKKKQNTHSKLRQHQPLHLKHLTKKTNPTSAAKKT